MKIQAGYHDLDQYDYDSGTAILYQIANMPNALLLPFSMSDALPMPEQRFLPSFPSVWVSPSSPTYSAMNITIFEGWRVNVRIPFDEWDDQRWCADDVKRAALIGLGRQFMGDQLNGRSVDIGIILTECEEYADVGEDYRHQRIIIQQHEPEQEAEPEQERSRPSAPEPLTPPTTTRPDHGHSECLSSTPHRLNSVSRRGSGRVPWRAYRRNGNVARRTFLQVPRFCRWLRTLIF